MPTTAPVGPPRPGFRPEVQGLRAVAVLLVVLFHTGVAFPGGFLGVDVFFVISGFVIGRLLIDEQHRNGTVALGRFYARRVRRLVPALAVMLAFVALASVVLLSPLGTLRDTVARVGAGASLYVGNFAVLVFQKNGYFDLGADTNPLLHTWTLGVEEQFYLFLPLLVIGVAGVARRRTGPWQRRLLIVTGVVAVCSFLLGALLSGAFGHHDGWWATRGRFAFYSSFTRAWEFLAGVAVAILEPLGRRLPRRAADVTVTAGLVAIVFAAVTQSGATPTPGPATLAPVVGSMLVILAGVAAQGAVRRLLAGRAAVWVGDRSYGWYLWHWPIIVFVAASFPTAPSWVLLLAGIGALGPTVVSYRYLEQPIRTDPGWLGRRAVGLAVGCGVVGVASFAVVAAIPTPATTGVRAVEHSLADRGPAATECRRVVYRSETRRARICTWAVDRPRGRVVLVGDSTADTLAAPMARRFNRAGYDLQASTLSGCPFADVRRVYPDPDLEAGCRRFLTESLESIVATRPALVVLASRHDAYVHLDEFTLADPGSGRAANDEATKTRLYRDGLTRTLEELAAGGVPAVVIATVPQLVPFNIQTCPAWRLWSDPDGCGRTLPRSTVESYRRAGLEATTSAVDAVAGTHLVDFIDELCTAEACSTHRDGRWLYSDSAHLSPLGAERLGPAMKERLVPRVRGWSGGDG